MPQGRRGSWKKEPRKKPEASAGLRSDEHSPSRAASRRSGNRHFLIKIFSRFIDTPVSYSPFSFPKANVKNQKKQDWTCSITRLVISQVLRFFRLKPKPHFSMEVVQKLKFLNNSIIMTSFIILS
jgi:hypothetical protein